MKRLVYILVTALIALTMAATACAQENDFASRTDEELLALYDALKSELVARGLFIEDRTLREGKYIIGEDVPEGEYDLECLSTSDDDTIGMMNSIGGMASGFPSEDGLDYGSLFGAFGSMMEYAASGMDVQILGDFGTVLKSYELKSGEKMQIRLEIGTALEISSGTCKISRR